MGEGAEAHDLQPGEVFGVSAWARARRPAGPQPGINFGRPGATGQLSGIWLGLWASASGGAAQSASMFIVGIGGIGLALAQRLLAAEAHAFYVLKSLARPLPVEGEVWNEFFQHPGAILGEVEVAERLGVRGEQKLFWYYAD